MMRTSGVGRAFIQGLEDCRLLAYQDTNGGWTIGWGHKGADVAKGVRWTQQEANVAFARDLYPVEFTISNLVRVPLTQYEFDALCSLVYNIGIGAFSTSTLLKVLNKDDRSGAAAQFPRWNKETIGGKLVVSHGLTQRRAAERAMFNGSTPRIVGA